MEEEIVVFFLGISDEDDAEERTCKKFGIDEQTLNYLLLEDLHNTYFGGN